MRLVALAIAALGGCPAPVVAPYVCEALLDCAAATAPGDYGALIDAYGPEGSCWVDQETADRCGNACVTLFEGYAEAYPDVEECAE